jgi:ribosomal protein S11
MLNWLNNHKKGTKVERKKIQKMNTYLEATQENPCVTILNKQKHHFFCKIGEQEDRTGPSWSG